MGFRKGGRGGSSGPGLLVPKNRKLAILGDSMTAQCSTFTSGYENYGYISHALRRCGQRFTLALADNYGVGGDTSTQAMARIPNVINSGVGTCVIMVGTNDRGSAAMTADQTMDNLKSMRDQLNARGIVAVFMTPLPRGDAANTNNRLSTAQLNNHLDVRRRILSELPQVGCFVVDLWPNLADKAATTGDIIAGHTHDGLHPNTKGAFQIGLALGDVLKTIVGPVSIMPVTNGDVFHATNNPMGTVGVNPMMLGTAGSPATGGSGNLADGWSGTNATGTTGVTRTYSKVTTATGDWQQCVIGGAAATANAAIDLARQVSLQASVVEGGVYELVGEYEIDAGMTNILSLQAGIQITDGSGTTTLWDGDRYTNDSHMPGVAESGVFRSPQMTIGAGTTDVRPRLACYLSTTGAPVGTIRFRNLAIRRVS